MAETVQGGSRGKGNKAELPEIAIQGLAAAVKTLPVVPGAERFDFLYTHGFLELLHGFLQALIGLGRTIRLGEHLPGIPLGKTDD